MEVRANRLFWPEYSVGGEVWDQRKRERWGSVLVRLAEVDDGS